MRRAALGTALTLALAACGQTGALVLPDADRAAAASATAPEPATADGNLLPGADYQDSSPRLTPPPSLSSGAPAATGSAGAGTDASSTAPPATGTSNPPPPR